MKRKYLLRSGINTARITRLIAKAIDILIVLVMSMLFYPVGLVLAIIYMALSDSLQNGRSVGKKIMGFAVISLEDGSPCGVRQSIVRNLPLIVPMIFAIVPLWGWIICSLLAIPLIVLEVIFLFKLDSGHRLGDVMADTSVIANDQSKLMKDKNKTSWFDEKKMSPVNRSVL